MNILLTQSLVNLYARILTSVMSTLRSVCTHDLGQDSPIKTSCSVNKLSNNVRTTCGIVPHKR